MCLLRGPFKVLAVPSRPIWVAEIDSRLWLFYATPKTKGSPLVGPGKLLVVDPSKSTADRLHEVEWVADMSSAPVAFGAITCGGIVPSHPDFVYLGHS